MKTGKHGTFEAVLAVFGLLTTMKRALLVLLLVTSALYAVVLLAACRSPTGSPLGNDGKQTVANPVITPSAGGYPEAPKITITCSTPGVKIHYTVDGLTPTQNSTRYTAPFTLFPFPGTVKAIAVKEGMNDSNVITATYSVGKSTVATPVANPAGRPFVGTQSVTLSCATDGASIYYTLDGNAPDTNSISYSGAITLTETTTVKAIAVKAGWNDSAVMTETYTKTAAFTPGAQWVRSITPAPSQSTFKGINADNAGNIYAAGNQDNVDAALVKYDAAGVQQWVRTVSGKTSEFADVVTDSAGNVYVIGYQNGTEAYNYGGELTRTGTNISDNLVLAKYDASGTVQWVNVPTYTGTGAFLYWRFNSLAVDSLGNIYVGSSWSVSITGNSYTLNFGNGVTADGKRDGAALVKYNTAGVAQWIKPIIREGGWAHDAKLNDIAVDGTGNIYAVGSSSGYEVDFGNGVVLVLSGSIPSSGVVRFPFLVMYDSAGDAQWVKTVEVYVGTTFSGLALDQWGNIYVSGNQRGMGTNDNNYGNGVTTTTTQSSGVVVKYDQSGTAQWVCVIAGDVGAIAVDSTGNVYASGTLDTGAGTGEFTFVIDGVEYTINIPIGSGFWIECDANGNSRWAQYVTGAGRFFGIVFSNDAVYVAGNQTGSANYGNGVTFVSSQGFQGMLVQYKETE